MKKLLTLILLLVLSLNLTYATEKTFSDYFSKYNDNGGNFEILYKEFGKDSFKNLNYNFEGLKNYKDGEKVIIEGGAYSLYGNNNDISTDNFANSYIEHKNLKELGIYPASVGIGGISNVGLFYKKGKFNEYLNKYKFDSNTIFKKGTPLYLSKELGESLTKMQIWSLSQGFENGIVEGHIKHIKFNGDLCITNWFYSDDDKIATNSTFLANPFCKTNSRKIQEDFLLGLYEKEEFKREIEQIWENHIMKKFNVNTTIFIATKITINNNGNKEVLGTQVKINKVKYNRIFDKFIKKILIKSKTNDKIIPKIVQKIDSIKYKKKIKDNSKMGYILNTLKEKLIYQYTNYGESKKYKEMEKILSELEFINTTSLEEMGLSELLEKVSSETD